MRSFVRNISLVIPFLLLSCAPKADVEGLKKTVDDFNNASIEAMTTGNSEKAIAFYSDDAISMPPNEAAIKGKENIKAWMDKMSQMGMKIISAKFNVIEVNAAGDLGYELGGYDMTMEMAPMGEIKDSGKYVAIWKKHQDGSWKVHAETWNSSMPMPSMEPPKDKKKK